MVTVDEADAELTKGGIDTDRSLARIAEAKQRSHHSLHRLRHTIKETETQQQPDPFIPAIGHGLRQYQPGQDQHGAEETGQVNQQPDITAAKPIPFTGAAAQE